MPHRSDPHHSDLPHADIESAALANRRTIWWQAPLGWTANGPPRRLMILLDAEFYLQRVQARPIIARWQEALGKQAPTVIYVSHIDAQTRFVECPCHEPFVRFISAELMPWLRKRLTVDDQPRLHAIGGLSYTGLLASFVALQADEIFGAVLCQSASFWWNDLWLVEKIRTRDPLPLRFSISCGNRETETNVRHRHDLLQVTSQLTSNRTMHDALRAKCYAVDYREFDGGHEMQAWRDDLPAALAGIG